MKVYIILLFTFIFFYAFSAVAQIDVKRNNGLTLSGSLHDSTRNIALEAASIALYKQGDEKVHSIALSSRTGKFVIDNLPHHTSFQLRVSNMGYDLLEREIFIRDSSINLGALYLLPRTNELEVVEVLSPVKLNGDTIEFNADAFHLDSNAVAGDLLAKLPGITIWGDNEITYNGKKINKLYVNGTDFFSTNSNIALQNIPKNIIEKVQIFDTEPEQRETKDANIVLKEGKDRGVFGKIGAGWGTNRQKELEAVTNLFNSSSQLAIGGSKSNINKPLNNVDQLLDNTTFGGVNLDAKYFSDLRKRGYHEDSAYGLLFKHDFRNNTSGMTADDHELKVDLFQKSSNSLSERNSNTIWLTSDESDNSTVTQENRTSEINNVLGKVSYKFKKNNRTDLDIAAKFERRKVDNNRSTSTTGQIYGIQTRENSQSLEELDQSIFTLNTALQIFGRSKFDRIKWYDNIYLKYNLHFNPSTSLIQTKKDIESTNTEFENRAFLRDSRVKRDMADHDAFSKLERILPHMLRGIVDIDIAQRIRLTHNNSDNTVRDSLKINEFLTYNEKGLQFNSTSSLSVGRKFIIDELYMRYEKSFGVYSNFDVQVTKDDVRSGYFDRNINRTNTFIMPSISVNYLNKIDHNFVKDLNLSWNISYAIL